MFDSLDGEEVIGVDLGQSLKARIACFCQQGSALLTDHLLKPPSRHFWPSFLVMRFAPFKKKCGIGPVPEALAVITPGIIQVVEVESFREVIVLFQVSLSQALGWLGFSVFLEELITVVIRQETRQDGVSRQDQGLVVVLGQVID